jgi:hypothetical protein
MPPSETGPESSARASAWVWWALGLLVLGTVLRLVHLGADPAYPLWAGYLTDEGRWTEQARELVLFGTATPTSEVARLHLLVAPLYQAVTVVPFSLLGVGLWTARLVSAGSAILLLVAAFLFLRRSFTGPGLVVVMMGLAFQPDLLMLSRVAIPEMAALLSAFLAFGVLVSAGDSRRRLFAAGLLTAMAVAFKVTTAPLVPIFALAAWVLGKGAVGGRPGRRLVAYLAGAIGPALLVLIVAGATGLLAQSARLWPTLQYFVGVRGPYGVFQTLMYREVTPSISVFILAAWLVAGLLLAVGPLPRDRTRDVWHGSALWAAGWLTASSVLHYFPDRYVLSVLVPLAVNVGAGITLLERVGKRRIVEAVYGLDGWKRALVAAWLSLPMAVLLAPSLIAAAGLGGLVLDRLTHHLVLIAAACTVVTALWLRRWRPGPHFPALLALPLLVVALRTLFVAAGLLSHGFWLPVGPGDLVAWIGLLALALGMVALAPGGGAVATKAATGLYVATLATAWLAQALPAVVTPTYTMREAGATIEALATEGRRVATYGADGLLVGTQLRYQYLVTDPRPELLVAAFRPLPDRVAEEYRLERRLEVNLAGREGAGVRIYRLVEDGRQGQDPVPAERGVR